MTIMETMSMLKCTIVVTALSLAACDNPADAVDPGPITTPGTIDPVALTVSGRGPVQDRFIAELWVQGSTGYTSTWGTRTVGGVQSRGNAIKIWNVAGAAPVLVDSVIVADATTLGDIQTTADGRYLVVATEREPGSIVIYDLADPVKPRLVSRFTNPNTNPGVHTAEVQTVNGRSYAFLSIDPGGASAARLVIADITDPADPREVFTREMGSPFVHDVFVRDGILMAALWNDGLAIFDIGGGGRGGSPANPVQLGSVKTVGGKAHNINWFHDPVTGSKRYAFVGEEGPGSIGSSSIGDIHVVDVSDMTNPREVAFFHAPGAGAHNFSSDEPRGLLYAAFYNGGVRALNVRGDLSTCTAAQMSADNRCDLVKMGREAARGLLDAGFPVFVWGVQYTSGRLYASD
ncbi:MAG: hypothetical protein ABIR58_07325, partial [Gemmatimonadaceae bacterium]